MSAESDYIRSEANNTLRTITLLDEKQLRQLAEPLPQLCRSFLEKVEKLNAS